MIGDAVNVAARVEADRELDRDVLLTPATVAAIGAATPPVESAGAHRLKGVGGTGRAVRLPRPLTPTLPRDPVGAVRAVYARGLRGSRTD